MPVLLDWIDPGNSGGSVLIPQSPRWRPTPTFYLCPYCVHRLASEAALQDHVASTHPIERPTLLLRGTAVESQLRLRRRVTHVDFQTLNCGFAFLRINGRAAQKLEPKKISQILAKQSDCEIALELHGEGRSTEAVATYNVQIVVPAEKQLEQADRHFVSILAKDDVALRDVEKFAKVCQPLNTCQDYVSGLADYVLGTLIKDQSGNVSLEFREHRSKYQAAVALLTNYDRPLAQIICTFVRFSTNDFLSPALSCGVEYLDCATAFFLERAGVKSSFEHKLSRGKSGRARTLCPIDQTSTVLLTAAADLWSQEDISLAVERIAAISERGAVTALDRAKAHVVLTEHYSLVNDATNAMLAARHLSNDPVFAGWAERFNES
jgi:hypothetical protein